MIILRVYNQLFYPCLVNPKHFSAKPGSISLQGKDLKLQETTMETFQQQPDLSVISFFLTTI